MAGKGQLVIRFIGDTRDLGKATAKAGGMLDGYAKAAGVAGVAAGAALAAGVVGAINVDKANDKLAAGLGLSAKKSKQVGKVAGNLYKNAYGESIEGVNDAVGAVMTSIDGMGKASGKRLESVTAKALDFASAFEVDVTRASQVAGQVVRTGLAKNATEAFDLLTTASHKVPKALREDVLDAADEYGQFFAGIGMNGKQTFAALVKGAEKGQFGIDKIGDAVKEFTIRSTDMSTASKDAYDAIGLDAGKMANKMTKGGKAAGKATQSIVKGLLDMKPGAKQANAAIALFGTPLEDLSVQEIPAFLKQLQGSGKAMDGFKGSTERMGKTLNDNAGTNLESFKRQVMSTFVEFVGGKALPKVNELASTLATRFGPAVKEATGFLERNSWVVKILLGVLGALASVLIIHRALLITSAVATKTATVATVAWSGATKVAGAVQWVWNAAMRAGSKAALGTRIQLAALAVQQRVTAIATGAWAVASKAAAVGTRVLGVAIRFAMGPVGLIITGITLLVGSLVWFFTKTKVGKAIVRSAWAGIKSAIKGVADWWTKTAWPAIKGALKAMGEWFRMVGRVAGRAWRGMGNVLGATWRWIKKNVIDRFVTGIKVWAHIIRVTARKVGDFWRALGRGLGNIWRWIKRNVIDRFVLGVKVWAAIFRLVGNKVAASFARMRDRLGNVGAWIRKNVFGRIGDALSSMRNGFKNAVSKIRTIWNGLKSAAARPVNFLIKWVWNKGLRKVLNAIPGVSLPEVNPVRFARGGPVKGGIPGKDSVRALMMPGEHVWTAKEVQAAGGQKAMYAMRDAVLKGNLNGDPKFAKGGELTAAAISKAQSFAKAQAGKPYGWGAVGPSSYDCSGFMSALTNVLQGEPAHRRRGATADFPWSGFKKGPGQFTIGSTPNYAGSGVGHMSGNLAGLGVESRGGRGVILGQGAMSPTNSGFSQLYHLGAGGKMGDKSAGWLERIKEVLTAVRKLPGQVREMMAGGSWINTFLRKMVSAVSANVAKFVNKKIPNWGPIPDNPIKPVKLASGGVVRHRPGGTHAIIGEGGQDEAVIPLGRGSGTQQVIQVNLDGDLGDLLLKAIRAKVKTGGGNPVYVLSGGRMR